MPYEWQDQPGKAELRVWPYHALTAGGFVWFIGLTTAAISLPLLALLGRAALWVTLPFAALAVGLPWLALTRNRSKGPFEVLTLTADQLALTHHDPHRPARHWQANPYWVRASLCHGPIEAYLTLTDGQREVELGAFLTPDERRTLHAEITHRLRKPPV
ncbi:MAG: DUF2244 domain-containing protein [Paracoccus sp. (in: a-proteobacteria)]|uniref:DUF2244 domain-containing protein n=1 Tax=Paracoccus sp. TaxID=267 RepID=UPI0026E0B42E|nr:DUF2244 domain-containing protein [Paracoccus sp. (in: a-proteobacteria)]MDO5621886.1 DUF2244 domain-containing protein [Paracoccus sp. (in: a-proteobacteria)]